MSRRLPSPPATVARPQAPSGAAARHALIEAVHRHQAGDLDAAAAACAQALNLDPRQPDALHLSAVIAHQRGDDVRARTLAEKALKRSPRNAAYHNTLGVVLLGLDKGAAAAATFRRALVLDPGYAEAHNNLGNALMGEGRPAEAEACYRRAIAARPGYAVAHNNLGSALRAQGRLDQAAAAYREALAHAPGYVGALSNLGRVLHELGHYDDALAHYERALALDPDHAESHANRGILLLLLGRLSEGWPEYEWRWRVKGFAAAPPDPDVPRWDGSPLAGRTLLVHAEQGLGSAIQFVRYVPLVAGRTVEDGGRVVLECPRPLLRLFRSIADGGAVDLVAKGERLPPRDVQAPLMSLPRILGTELATIPARVPYLRADPTLEERWRDRLARWPRPRVGLVWGGNPRHENDANRSMPVAALAPLLERQGITLFSLQVGARPADRAWLGQSPVQDLAPELGDFADTAAALSHLDLLVSVDTAAAHLAGALGRPVWLLLPFVPEWRWMLTRDDSPWYPTLRLFRQTARGDWTELMARIATALDRIKDGMASAPIAPLEAGGTIPSPPSSPLP